ncbi:phage tail spike protein [Bacillus capparidis]|uniref:Phage minor structural protein n=1 Tax=Bacillus capparidis TaxID=1840411 RepID=A0ABS4D1J8_9BACI|nr:phage tail spike protein [Bacillus capparidis]MBP1083509.1 phage minor structural protein [Bacillus capparidis]MED1094708.1 phage tail spike protein [Bacillus capparidis]
MIHVLHHQTDNLIGWVDFAFEDTHSRSLNNETLDFIAPTDADDMDKIQGRSRLLIPAEEGDYREFIVDKIYESRVSKQTEIYSIASYTDLQKSKVIAPAERDGQTLESAADFVLEGLEWQVGIVEYSGIRKWTIEKHLSAYEALKAIASLFECELVFRVTTDGDKVTGRYVDFLTKQGMNRGKEITFGKDLIDINRTIDPSRVVTALFCIGPEREDGTRLTVTVTNNEAFQNWNRKGQHLIEIYEPESYDQNMTMDRLKQLGETELKKRIAAAVNYEVEGASLEHILGYEHEITRIGDTAKIKDESFVPEMYLDSRVIQIDRSIFDESKKVYTLGEVIEYEKEDVMRLWKDLQSLYATRVIKSPTPPAGKPTIIWIKTGGPVDIPHSWDGSGWIPFSPLKAEDINAETPVGAQDKADYARDQANHYTDSQLKNYVDAITYNQDLSEIQNQIDGNITSWFYDYEPSLMNVPASGWTTNDQKNNHLGDLFYNTSTGYSYRFTLEGSNYQWTRLTDNDVTKALSDASKAQDTADSKRRVFVNQPIPPYEVGDLWTQGNSGDIMRCQAAKAARQPFSSADWSKASKYTDDSGAIKYTNDQLDQVEETIGQIENEVSQRELSIVRHDVEPTGGGFAVGQLWLRTTDFTFHRWTGSVWEQLTPSIGSVDGKVNINTYNQKVQEITQDIAAKAGLDYVNGQLVSKADKANTYTKLDVDSALNNKVSVTSYTTDKNGIVQELNDHSSRIYQSENEIATKVSQSEFTNLTIGGRNLLFGSGTFSSKSGWGAFTSNTTVQVRVDSSAPGKVLYGENNNSDGLVAFHHRGQMINVVPGEEYSFSSSFNTNHTGEIYFAVKFTDSSNNDIATAGDFGKISVTYDKWYRINGTVLVPQNTVKMYLTLRYKNTTGVFPSSLSIYRPKLEKGNRATDWTPAPEDTDAAISGIDTRLSSAETFLTETAQQIQLRATKTEVESSINSVNQRINKANASITVNSNAIALKADKTYVDSVEGRVSQAELSLSVQAGQITSKVSQSDFNNLNNKVTLNSDSTNYCINPSFEGGSSVGWSGLNWVGNPNNGNPTTYVGEIKRRDINCGDFFPVKSGDKFFVSLDSCAVMENGKYDIGLGFWGQKADGTNVWVHSAYRKATSTWGTTSAIITIPDGWVRAKVQVLQNGWDNFGRWRFTNVRVSKIVPQSQVDGLDSRLSTSESLINQLSNEVDIRVKQVDYDIDMNDLTSRMSSAESSLTVQAGQIAARVEKNGVISAINVSPENVMIKSNKLLIGDFTNLAAGSDFEDTNAIPWGLASGYTIDSYDKHSGSKSLKISRGTGNKGVRLLGTQKVNSGEKFYVEYWFKCTSDWNGTEDNSKLRFGNKSNVLIAAVAYGYSTTWVKRTGVITVNETTDLIIDLNSNNTVGSAWIDDIIIRRMTNTELIVNGSITTDALATDAVTADKINVSSLSAITANLGTVNAGTLNAVTLNGATGTFSGKLTAGLVDIEYGAILWRGDPYTIGQITYYEGVIDYSAAGHDFHGWMNLNGSPVHTERTIRSGRYTVYGTNGINRMRRTVSHGLGFVPRVSCTASWQSGCVSINNINLVYTENVNASTFDIVVAGNRTFSGSEYIYVDIMVMK